MNGAPGTGTYPPYRPDVWKFEIYPDQHYSSPTMLLAVVPVDQILRAITGKITPAGTL